MKNLRPILVAATALSFAKTLAQMPRLEIGEKRNKNSVSLQSMNVDVEIFGNLAKTTTTLVFRNTANRNLEGNLIFPLPDKTTVSGYAIDINGTLRNAVPVEKARAVEVFESIQKQNIDPGIIEKVEGNSFRTRISPIPMHGTRTVQVAYFQQLKRANTSYQYHLPLDNTKSIAQFHLHVKVFNASEKPQLTESPDGSFHFSENSNIYEASLAKTDFKPTRSLTINLPKSAQKIESFLQKNTDGSAYFYANTILDIKPKPKIWPQHLGIIWDNSLSGMKRDHKKELDFIGKIIAQQPNIKIDVAHLHINLEKAKSFQIQNGDWTVLKNYLGNVVYDGGTNYSKISSNILSADEYLFFSDGISSFGSTQFSLNKPIFTVASSATSNFGVLKYIAQNSNGKFVNLNESSAEQAFEQINTQALQFLGIKNQQDFSEIYPMVGTEVQQDFSVSGITQNGSRKIVLQFGRKGKVELEKEISLDNASQVFAISKVWAQQKIDFLELNAEQNKADIAEIGKQFSIVTSNTSLIVLENVADYVKYKIEPPTELRQDYDNLAKQGFTQREQRQADLLKKAIAKAKELQQWWNTDFKPVKQKYPTLALDSMSAVLQGRAAGVERTTSDRAYENILEETVVVANGPRRVARRSVAVAAPIAEAVSKKDISSNADNRPVPEIKIAHIKSDKDYIKAIEASKNPYQTYLDLRAAYAETPSYFFDVATYFFQKNDNETGLRILSSIADLGLENAELYKLLAFKLKETEQYPSELFIAKKVLDWRPFDAQSHRDYALALQDNGHNQEALDNLYKVLTNNYSIEIAMRDRDITEIIVPEINNLVALHRKELDISHIEKELLIDIPVDIRVVMNWNKDMTDIDLWVTDPNNEKCFYSHKTTAIGGRISDDVTQGFGPEQFLLKKAIKGKYKIESNFFAERQMSIAGPTTISVEIYLLYSSNRQTRKMLTFQNGKSDHGKDGILVSEFEF